MIREYTADLKEFYKRAFDSSEELKDTLYRFNITEDRGSVNIFLYKVIEFFLVNESFSILLNSADSAKAFYEEEYRKYIEAFSYEKGSPLYEIQVMIFQEFNGLYIPWADSRNSSLYEQLIFAFNHGNVKNYFYTNRKRFLPEYDWFLIENNENKKTHIEAFFREFDKFSDIINYMADLTDIENVPEDKIAYLSAILGLKFDLEEDTIGYANMPKGFYEIELFSPYKIRSLIRNIVEIYRTKGSMFAYELFFNSIGIEISLKETYFDRRIYWRSKNAKKEDEYNPETRESKTYSFFYYLTTQNPAIYYNEHSPGEIISPMDMTEPKTETLFNNQLKKIEKEGKSVEDLLGYGNGYSGETFTYFKTNVLLLDFKYYMADVDQESVVSQYHLNLITSYIDMITPIYIRKYYPDFELLGHVSLDSLSLEFKSGSDYSHYYDQNGKYIERERSDGIGRNFSFSKSLKYEEEAAENETPGHDHPDELKIYKWEEAEGFPVPEHGQEDEYPDSTELLHAIRGGNKKDLEEYDLGFDNVFPIGRIEEEDLYSFEDLDGYVLNNIDFTWEPIVSNKNLSINNGYFEIDNFFYESPVVAVEAQNIGESSILVTLEDLD